jgi:hypothetical protein
MQGGTPCKRLVFTNYKALGGAHLGGHSEVYVA